MHTTRSAPQGIEQYTRSLCYPCPSRIHRFPQSQASVPDRSIRSVVIVDFRDEVYASIARLMNHHGLITYRVESISELTGRLVRYSPELVLLSGTQPDESAWLASAKLRIIDANRPVWIYSPEPPSALDAWLSMVRPNDVIVYGGVLQRLLDLMQDRLFPDVTPIKCSTSDGERRTVA